MSDGAKKRAHVLKPFKDEGTGQSYKAGDTPMIDAGSFGNYKAAELVEAAAVVKATKPKRRPSRAAAKAKSAPPAQTADTERD